MSSHSFQLALVTGSTSGIGEALARLLAQKKIALLLTGRNEEKLKQLKAELSNVSVETLVADLSTSEGRKQVIALIHRREPDLVINNAGVGLYGDVLMSETQEAEKLIELDVVSVFSLSIEAARTLLTAKKKGTILNVSSAAAFPIFPGFTVYSAAKACVNQFSESFDAETASQGVRVLAACPGYVATQFRSNAKGTGQSLLETGAMSADFAAQEIWKQILSGKRVRVFNWRYRFMNFFVKYIFPKSLVAFVVHKSMQAIKPPTPIIKVK